MPTKCYSYIRFSSEKQAQGDSIRRQIELSKKYAENHNLILDDTLNMMDLGLSAYRGDHVDKGELGTFLILLKKGKIEKGSILLVESFDKLSRQNISTSFTQFISILDAGITIVTLEDNQKYTPDSINDDKSQLIISLTTMSRAYQESRTKQIRISAAWEEKRKCANNKILTSKCPNWMSINNERTRFELIQERAEIIKRIFHMYLDGNGTNVIAKKFNEEKIATWGCSELWGKSYIWKILRERTTIGEYQPKKFDETRKTVPACDPIKDYYPAVITEELFYKVQSQLEKRRTNFGKTATFANLFSHVVKCGYCGSNMHYVNKGKPPKGRKYLVCERAKRGGGCVYRSIPYQAFEESILQISTRLDIKEIIEDKVEEAQEKIFKIEDEINRIEFKISESRHKIGDWLDHFSGSSEATKATVSRKIDDEHIIIESYTELLNEQNITLDNLKSRDIEIAKTLSDLSANISSMKEYSGDALCDLRRKIKMHFQNIIDNIEIFPLGVPWDNFSYLLEASEPKMINQIYDIDADDIKFMSKENRRYCVRFKEGGFVSAKYDIDSKQYSKVNEMVNTNNIKFTLGKPYTMKLT